jgi:hypothetical protein
MSNKGKILIMWVVFIALVAGVYYALTPQDLEEKKAQARIDYEKKSQAIDQKIRDLTAQLNAQ